MQSIKDPFCEDLEYRGIYYEETCRMRREGVGQRGIVQSSPTASPLFLFSWDGSFAGDSLRLRSGGDRDVDSWAVEDALSS